MASESANTMDGLKSSFVFNLIAINSNSWMPLVSSRVKSIICAVVLTGSGEGDISEAIEAA